MGEELSVVCTVQGEVEETQARSFLAAHGISTSVRGEALRKTHAFVVDGLGHVEILTRVEDAEEAKALLDQAERGEFAIDESPEA